MPLSAAAAPSATAPLVLASTSVYRAQLLDRLGLAFSTIDPGVDERAEKCLKPALRARRLAITKARAVAERLPEQWIIGSDQVASCSGVLLHKPGSAARQRAQLRQLSGRTAWFHTAVCLVGPGFRRAASSTVRVTVRTLDAAAIRRYVAAEPAHDCAGGFRCEALGISLFERISSSDPTALEGLPLIATCGLLRAAGFRVP